MDNLQEKVIGRINEAAEYFRGCRSNASLGSKAENHFWELQSAMQEAAELLKAQEPQWRPFVKRALTEEEQKHHPDWCYILDGEVPEDEEEILVYRPWNNKAGYIIEMDTYCNNGDEVYLDGAGDIENGMYWMPLPEPPKEE